VLAKNVNGYSIAAVDRVLAAMDGEPFNRVRAELLDIDDALMYELKGLELQGSVVSHNTDQPVRGSATLKFTKTLRDAQHNSPLGTFISTIAAEGRLFHLRLNEASGNAVDYTGNGRTFTANGGITYSRASLTVGDTADNAVQLNGTTGYYSIADAAWMDVSRITLIGAYSGIGTGALMDRWDGGSNLHWRLAIDTDGTLFFMLNFTTGSPVTLRTTIRVNDGLPHLICALYDGTRMMIEVDGKRQAVVSETRTMKTGTLGINIGRALAASLFLGGIIDEFGMLDRALSSIERRNEYQAWSNQRQELIFDKDRGSRCRIWAGVRMPTPGTDGSYFAEWPQIVAVLRSPKEDYDRATGTSNYTIACQDKTRILADDTLASRITLLAGANYITGANGVLAVAQSAGFDTSSWAVTSTTLTPSADVDFEIGVTKLEIINYYLKAIVYKPIRFSGSGVGIIEPDKLDKDIALSETLSSAVGNSVISAESLSIEIEPRQVVNAVVVENANPDLPPIRGAATNASSSNRTSQAYNQPYVKTIQVDAPTLAVANAIALQELSNETARYGRRLLVETLWRPIHEDRDKIHWTIPELGERGLDEDMVEESWTLPLDPTTAMSHVCLGVVDVTL
jgi:hypothetical protein